MTGGPEGINDGTWFADRGKRQLSGEERRIASGELVRVPFASAFGMNPSEFDATVKASRDGDKAAKAKLTLALSAGTEAMAVIHQCEGT